MKPYKICFWLNTKSTHQNPFLNELYTNNNIDLKVRYISNPSQNRIDIGWDNTILENFEKYVSNFNEAKASVEDYNERIHIILGNKITFSQELINFFVKKKLKWIHWSERYGLVLANKLNFNILLFRILRPIYLCTKFSYGNLVNNYALGAFSHGELAKKDFEFIGIKKEKIKNLFYTSEIQASENIVKEKNSNIINFLYVGELSKRKGIEDLLRACSKLSGNQWSLTLVGKDKSNGYYSKLIKELKITNNIEEIGVISYKKIGEYYNKADIFVFPSKFDGWGAVLNEAISYELPIISSNEASSSFTLIKDNGFIFNAGKINELSSYMQKYIDNHYLIEDHSKNSKRLSEICTPKANVNRLIEALEQWI